MALSIARGGVRPFRARDHVSGVAQAALACALLAAGWFAASRLTLVTPGPYAREHVLAARPPDLPAVRGARLVEAGPGRELAYRLEYVAATPPTDARAELARGTGWIESVSSTAERLELIRQSATGSLDYIARFALLAEGTGTRVIVEFSPLPIGLAPLKSP